MSGVGEPSWSVHEHISCLGWGSSSVQVVNADVPGGRWLGEGDLRWARGVSASSYVTREYAAASRPLPCPSHQRPVAGGHGGVPPG